MQFLVTSTIVVTLATTTPVVFKTKGHIAIHTRYFHSSVETCCIVFCLTHFVSMAVELATVPSSVSEQSSYSISAGSNSNGSTGTKNQTEVSVKKEEQEVSKTDLFIYSLFNESYVLDLDDRTETSSSASSVNDDSSSIASRRVPQLNGAKGESVNEKQNGTPSSITSHSNRERSAQSESDAKSSGNWSNRTFGKFKRMVKRVFVIKQSSSHQSTDFPSKPTSQFATEHEISSMEDVGVSRTPPQPANLTDDLQQEIISLQHNICQNIVKPQTQSQPESSSDQHALASPIGISFKSLPITNQQSLNTLFTSRPSHLPIQRLLPSQTLLDPNRITLVLDLDETLSHSILEREYLGEYDYSFQTIWNWEEVQVKVKFRPYLKKFLQFVMTNFEVVVFSASLPQFANPVLDKIDPEGKIFTHRLFRDSCTFWNGLFVKDLVSLNRNISKTFIIDNSPLSYMWNVANAIPVRSWYQDPQDEELLRIMNELERLVQVQQVDL